MRQLRRVFVSVSFVAMAACANPAASGDSEQLPETVVEANNEAKNEAKNVAAAQPAAGEPRGVGVAEKALATDANQGVASGSAAGHFAGTVENLPFVPTHNFFMRGIMQAPGEPEVLIFVQTDTPELCEHLAQGTMPSHATMFAVALRHAEDGPLEVGGTYMAPNSVGRSTDLLSLAYFRRLDGRCEITPEPTGAEAESGFATLRALVDGQSAALDYALTLTTGDEVHGSIEATYCVAPALFERPEVLMGEVDPADCR